MRKRGLRIIIIENVSNDIYVFYFQLKKNIFFGD